ncbi:AbrB family looped-hinge helix DNA binding protein [Alicyclobacillus sacchari]|uniref:AbrB family looped-hinge helix DNA binding protein n=1 Tax=Alicyclobacillus sacchari TaxID=392010 RepID=A0A4R8LDY5_9BACL|nr:AbrB/MazE/SpoVT family DNA-binding domain-containing protein [Alicyclobacillus sacchari]TDY40349.1 AbrB family looped-hinge helix DNA binding protein [Alicyclobacillus sacchari]GMA59477.1 hypothetical protein GCM10025858_39810 [Alicyclobacillus sacchari]
MIHISTVTSKYQITIPLEIRQKEGIKVGDKVMFQYMDNGDIVIRPIRKKTARELGGYLHQTDTGYIPLGEVRRRTQEELGMRLEDKDGDHQ